GGTSGKAPQLPPIPLFLADGTPNHKNVASYAVHHAQPVHVPDAYDAKGFDFSGTKSFDARSGYRTRSLFTVPLIDGENTVIGVLQLLNAQDPHTGQVVPFSAEDREIVVALATQAGLALDNKLLVEAQKELLESFIKLIASAIDSKSPYTGGHCERVPVLTEMLMQAVCASEVGPFADFKLSHDEWYELRIAAWLHDCGKVTTPVHVMDKATKLETIFDRMGAIRHRFEILERDLRIASLEARLRGETSDQSDLERGLAELRDELAFLEKANVGGEFLPPDAQERIRRIGARTFVEGGESRPLLDENELENLTISRGTLTDDERLIINGHMVETIRMLEALPFPKHLQRVPEYAGGHHEKMDGHGYPKGVYAGDMSVPARAMAIADVFEALTAADRPYKSAKRLSEAMKIMGFMKRDNHLDPALFDLFVTSGTYRRYAAQFLDPSLLDSVDEAALLAITPKPFDLPPEDLRNIRRGRLLAEYEERFPASLRGLATASHPPRKPS
ncbi:MAG TPA: HD domain-containing phosphohydrolase, partial [Polyangiaceae bacterium]|nr:HD domain-containing phosphohydrolase [Polyangiaceae bacterium]